MSLIRVLHEHEREKLLAHFLSMDKEGTYKRFCRSMNENAIQSYVEKMDFDKTAIFVIENPSGDITGVGELFVQDSQAECAFSVLPEAQGRGYGHALMDRVVLHAKNHGVEKLSLMCLSDNRPMRKLAEEVGMHLKYVDGGDMEGCIDLENSTFSEHVEEMIDETAAEIGHLTSESIRRTSELMETMTSNWMSMLVPWKFAFSPAGNTDPVPKKKMTP